MPRLIHQLARQASRTESAVPPVTAPTVSFNSRLSAWMDAAMAFPEKTCSSAARSTRRPPAAAHSLMTGSRFSFGAPDPTASSTRASCAS